jgi:hypothetical protein
MNKFRFWFYTKFRSNGRIFLEFYSKHKRGEILRINDDINCEILASKKLKNGNYTHCVKLYSSRKELIERIKNLERLLGMR